jgi:hypothetical protein
MGILMNSNLKNLIIGLTVAILAAFSGMSHAQKPYWRRCNFPLSCLCEVG